MLSNQMLTIRPDGLSEEEIDMSKVDCIEANLKAAMSLANEKFDENADKLRELNKAVGIINEEQLRLQGEFRAMTAILNSIEMEKKGKNLTPEQKKDSDAQEVNPGS